MSSSMIQMNIHTKLKFSRTLISIDKKINLRFFSTLDICDTLLFGLNDVTSFSKNINSCDISDGHEL